MQITPISTLPTWQEEDTERIELPEGTRLHGQEERDRRDRCTLTVVEGPVPGAVFTMDGDEMTLGRSRRADVFLDDPSSSRLHARVFRLGSRYFVEDLESKNGTLVDGRRISRPRLLADGDRIQLGSDVRLRFHLHDEREQRTARQLYECAVQDALTGIHNRRFFDERLVAEVAFSRRHGAPLSLLMLDVDHFKMINDGFGHLAGDAVLRVIARTAKRIVRLEDLVARYGGEEFCVLLRAMNTRNASIVAERLRRTIESMGMPWEGRVIRATVSVGVATCSPASPLDARGLVEAADAALYRAKETGRNRCCEAVPAQTAGVG